MFEHAEITTVFSLVIAFGFSYGIMIEQVPWWSPLVGYALGWIVGRLDRETQDDPRRRFNHENRCGPVGPPPFKLRRTKLETPPSGPRPRRWSQVRRALDGSPRFDEGRVQRGNGKGGPTTPKPNIIPKPQFPSPRSIRDDFLQ